MHLSLLLKLSSALLCASLGTAASPRKRDVETRQAEKPPNFLFILTDDQDARMGSLGYMKKVQQLLIDEGTQYTRHYAPTALCCPARVSLLTGLHAHNHKITSVSGINGGWHAIVDQGINSNYLPVWLRQAGYATYYTGKLFNGMTEDMTETARGWTKADLLVGSKTYQYFDPPFQHVEGNWNNPAPVHYHTGNYTTTEVANYAYDYLKEAVKKEKPFFVGIAPITPHAQVGDNGRPPVPAKKYEGTLSGAQVPRAENFNPVNRSGVNFVWELERHENETIDGLDLNYQNRVEALLSVDDIVEEVVNILDAADALKNTYIIYSSDNGFHLGHHRLVAGKKFAFEEDINVPFIIRGPGVPRGRKTEIVTEHVDFAPTILGLANAGQQGHMFDGKPIPHTEETITARENAASDEHANVEFWTGATFKLNGKKVLRPNSYKSLRLASKTYDIMYAVQCVNNSHELYNMNKDPVQMVNLHPMAPHERGEKNAFDNGQVILAGMPIKKLLGRLDALLMLLKSCAGVACRDPWSQLHPEGGVTNLRGAMDAQFDQRYKDIPSVRWEKCHNDGTINLQDEGRQWNPDWVKRPGTSRALSSVFDGLDDSEVPQIVELDHDETIEMWGAIDGGYIDDWE